MFWPMYSNGSIWAVEQVRRPYPSGDVSAIRWAEVDVTAWPQSVRIKQDMTLAEERVWKFFPALTVDTRGNVAIVYGQSSVREFASAYYTGRLASDPPNTLRPSGLLKAGLAALTWGAAQGKVFYGDYFGASIDPLDGSAWLLGEYVLSPDKWGNWIGNLDWATAGPSSPPSAPTNLTFTVIGTTVTLNWNAPTSGGLPTFYVLEAGSSPASSNVITYDTGGAATSLSAPNVGQGTCYVRVRAGNGVGVSGPSNEVVVSIGGPGPCTTRPSAPTSLTASVGGFAVMLTWSAAAGATAYVLEAGSSPGSSNIFAWEIGASTSLTANAPSGTYYVRVKATNPCGTSGPSNEVILAVGG